MCLDRLAASPHVRPVWDSLLHGSNGRFVGLGGWDHVPSSDRPRLAESVDKVRIVTTNRVLLSDSPRWTQDRFLW